MDKCDTECKSKCWADYVDKKNSFLAKFIFFYVIALLTLSNFLLKSYTIQMINHLKDINNHALVYFLEWQEFIKKCLYFYTIAAYIYAFLKDPGYIPQDLQPPQNIQIKKFQKICQFCKTWKPPRAYHCKRCQKCVFKMDHHCFFINNCVGYKNQKSYILFLIGMIFYVIFYFANAIFSSIYIYKLQLMGTVHWTFILKELISVILLMHGCFFFQYVYNLLRKQLEGIIKNQTEVESEKRIKGQIQTYKQAFQKVFGKSKLLFFIPYFHKNQNNYLEETYLETQQKEKDLSNTQEYKNYFVQLIQNHLKFIIVLFNFNNKLYVQYKSIFKNKTLDTIRQIFLCKKIS